MKTLAELRLLGSDLLSRRGGACSCDTTDRRPRTERVGNLILTTCARCGGFTTPKEA